jgi:hypothetical protein
MIMLNMSLCKYNLYGRILGVGLVCDEREDTRDLYVCFLSKCAGFTWGYL